METSHKGKESKVEDRFHKSKFINISHLNTASSLQLDFPFWIFFNQEGMKFIWNGIRLPKIFHFFLFLGGGLGLFMWWFAGDSFYYMNSLHQVWTSNGIPSLYRNLLRFHNPHLPRVCWSRVKHERENRELFSVGNAPGLGSWCPFTGFTWHAGVG